MIEVTGLSRAVDFREHGRGDVAAFCDDGILTIRGWAFGEEDVATEVTVLDGGTVVAGLPISLERPDVTRTFGEEVQTKCGFEANLVPARRNVSELRVCIRFEDGDPVELGRVHVSASVEPTEQIDGPAWSLALGDEQQPKALTGRDGWLFLQHDRNDVIGQHVGRVGLSSADKEKYAQLLARRMDAVARADAVWLLAVVPDKEAVYADALPRAITPTPRRPVHDVLEIASSVGAPVVYLLDELIAARPDGEVYMRTDTHWNYRGAYVAYREICKNLRGRGVAVETLEESSIRWWGAPVAGDLGSKLGVKPVVSPFTRVEIRSSRSRLQYDNGVRNHGRVKIFEHEGQDGPSCVVFGESFVESVLVFLCHSFARLVFVHTSAVVSEVIDVERPDVVLNLATERFLIRVPEDENALTRLIGQVRDKGGELPWTSDPPERIAIARPPSPEARRRRWRHVLRRP
jgi:alginate O-acetyltransferase complex protein AlgJ